jgi:excinuclease ABC subunit C
VNAISQEEYRQIAVQVCEFLEGRRNEIVKQLEQFMWEAAEREEFEKAAKLRDQIRAIQTVTERQAVHLPIREDIDAYAFASEMGLGCVQMLLVRGGMLLSDQHFIVRVAEGQSAAEILSAFVKQRYSSGVPVPKIVLLPVELEDADLIAEWLSEKRSEPVAVRTAASRVLRDLLDIAEQNAKQALREELFREEQEKIAREYALRSLQSHLNLPSVPHRIECYDISTTMGVETVGSMVVFVDGKPEKSEYRKFRVKGAWILDETTGKPQPDDYAAMREVLTRRFRHYFDGDPKFSQLPDLLLVDGGKGQLSVALQVLKEFKLNLPVAALAKEHELLYLPHSEAPIALPFNSPALHLLQRIRDEAHRFALKFHRKRRTQRALRTILDEVPGIGPIRKKALLQHFGSLDALMKASVDELAKVPHMNRKAAKALWEFLHQKDLWSE